MDNLAGGPTASTRMDALRPPVLEKCKTKIIIGKGGLDEVGKKSLANFGSIYSEFTGGLRPYLSHVLFESRRDFLRNSTQWNSSGSEK